MLKSWIIKAGLWMALSLAGAAHAGIVTETYSFVLSGFVDEGSTVPSPLASIAGSFTLTFDPTQYYDNDTADIIVNYLTDTHISSPIGFDNFPAGIPGRNQLHRHRRRRCSTRTSSRRGPTTSP